MENQNATSKAKSTWEAGISRLVVVKDAEGKWRFPVATWICALAPWVLLLNMTFLALHVRLGLGHWPEPMVENYRTPLFNWHGNLCSGVFIFAICGALPLFGVLLFIRRFRLSFLTHMVQLGAYLVGWLAIVFVGWLDPFRYVTWLLD